MIGGDARERACPLCGEKAREQLVSLAPEQFCGPNPTYRRDAAELLQLSTGDRFPLGRCRGCGHVYAVALPPPEFLQTVYERVIVLGSCVGASESAQAMARRLRYVRELLSLTTVGRPRALDFGCGSGPTVALLGAAGAKALGFDVSSGRVLEGRERSQRHVTQSWDDVLTAAPYDLVVCDNVLEHLAEPVEAVSRIGSVLRSGAFVYVSVPDYGPARLEGRLATARAGGAVDATLNPWEHLSYFSLPDLDRLLRVAGLRRLGASELPGTPDVGLRPERNPLKRVMNSLATAMRLGRYAATGRGVETTEHNFYIKDSSAAV